MSMSICPSRVWDDYAIPYKITPIKSTVTSDIEKRMETSSRKVSILFSQMHRSPIRKIEPYFVGSFSTIRADPPAPDNRLALTGGFGFPFCNQLQTIGDGIFRIKIAHCFTANLHPDRMFVFRVPVFEHQQSRFKTVDAV